MRLRRQSVHLAQHYFRLIAEQAGVKWDGDNDTEDVACWSRTSSRPRPGSCAAQLDGTTRADPRP